MFLFSPPYRIYTYDNQNVFIALLLTRGSGKLIITDYFITESWKNLKSVSSDSVSRLLFSISTRIPLFPYWVETYITFIVIKSLILPFTCLQIYVTFISSFPASKGSAYSFCEKPRCNDCESCFKYMEMWSSSTLM